MAVDRDGHPLSRLVDLGQEIGAGGLVAGQSGESRGGVEKGQTADRHGSNLLRGALGEIRLFLDQRAGRIREFAERLVTLHRLEDLVEVPVAL